nr:bulb-type lectin domain-containing protein [Tanacetum cinerariifolium]
MGGYMNVTFNDKWYQVAKILGLAYEHHETVKEVYKEYIGMVKVYYEEAKRSRHGEPRDVAVNCRGTAGRERPQMKAIKSEQEAELPIVPTHTVFDFVQEFMGVKKPHKVKVKNPTCVRTKGREKQKRIKRKNNADVGSDDVDGGLRDGASGSVSV